MNSQLVQAMIVDGMVLTAVLATDPGKARKIGRMRIARPLIVAAVSGIKVSLRCVVSRNVLR